AVARSRPRRDARRRRRLRLELEPPRPQAPNVDERRTDRQQREEQAMNKIRAFFRDAHVRALTIAFALTGIAFTLTGGALATADDTAQIAASGTVGTYSIVPMAPIPWVDEGCTTASCIEYAERNAVEKIMTSQFRPRTV